ncbi:cytochrome oxidase assembly protein-domain-containing protein [Neohortaea acidophila]|uniref:Cytochrome oxidase assembly protein-domain-containing protein n=1 Tax=Neohortaea acidophila TaxID=245834 RepID=A0A6A6PS04_9PEZI|nr:cytochrome oxidase assembly protein-domain-containing protein [Neohortaea acidophila]KAF2482444.1 cytochrome oxidase assembly protein-domain-containing protein [Neohortaea acidophila]
MHASYTHCSSPQLALAAILPSASQLTKQGPASFEPLRMFLSPLRIRLASKASRILEEAFVCKRCLQHQSKARKQFTSTRQTPFLNAFRRHQSSSIAPNSPTTSALNQAIQSASRSTSQSSWPKTSHKSVAYWLLGSAASVFGIVVFGGLTRLTESGLSITEWRPVTGSLPPRHEADWEEEFARYKLSPEFKMLNSRMNLEEFKQIYWMEWTHRLWGRVVGVTFLLPTAYFVIRRRVTPGMAWKLTGICGMIGFQGFLGWWMVKSGLKDDLFEQGKHPRVSQYRLAAHLGTAFAVYLAMVWNGLSILREHRWSQKPSEAINVLNALRKPELMPFRRLVGPLSVLVFVTAMSGALVAGLDAGLIYNDFPWMGQGLIPPKREMLDSFYSHRPDEKDLVWRNMLENPVLVQLDHRILATTSFCAIIGLWAYSRFNPRVRAAMPREVSKATRGVVHLALLQVTLGITTLWYLVPTPLAAAHQAGALALLTGVALLGSRVVVSRRGVRLVEQALKLAKEKKVEVKKIA